MRTRSAFHSITLCSLLFSLGMLVGCTKEDSGNSDSSDGGSGRGAGKASSECGIVVNGSLENPANLKDATQVTIRQVISGNLVVLSPQEKPGQRLLVKLHGVYASRDKFKNQRAIQAIQQRTAGGASFFKATEDCEISIDGGKATIGTLVTQGGLNLNEFLIANALVEADSRDACGGELIRSCYNALEEGASDTVAGQLRCGFLWKPLADKDGKLVVHVDECNVDIYANGEKLNDAGSGNGRCSTGRGPKPGCAYGGNARIKVIDRKSGLPYVFPDGSTEYVLDGCKRVEFPC